ncbi:MAG: hypothetical protein IJ899_10570 [Blautia sp.]|nr:hypothetical protein [Blautia sp.]
MNPFFNEDQAKDIRERAELEELFRRVNEDPEIMKTLSLHEILKLNKYMDEIIREQEELLHKLESFLAGSD